MARMTETGHTGLSEWGGFIQEDFLRELRGQEGYRRYNEMRLNDPIVGSLLLAIELSIRSVDWTWESDDGEDDPRLELFELCEKRMSHNIADHITEALTMLPFGYSVFEIVYQPGEGSYPVLWRKFAIRGQDTVYRWMFDDDGGLAGLEQQVNHAPWRIEIPIEKLILYRTRSEKNNPEGRSVLRTAWTPYYYAKNLRNFEAIGEERGLAGLPTMHLPEGATTDLTDSSSDASVAAKMVRNIRTDEQAGIVLPFGWELTLLSTGANRAFQTDSIIKRYETRMLMASLAQFLTLGLDKVGSLALSRDQTDFFVMAVNAYADIIAETITKYAIPRLCKLNGIDPEGLRLAHSLAGDVDLAGLGDFLQKTTGFVTWLPGDEAWLRSAANLPEVTPEEIEAEKERRRAEMMERMAMQPANPFQRGGDNGNQGDDRMMAQLFAADDAPDDDERQRDERRWFRTIRDELARQREATVKAAKRLK